MSSKVKKKFSFKKLFKKTLIYTGTTIFTIAISYLLIIGTEFVNSGLTIIFYTVIFFIVVPGLSFLLISGYLYLLDRLLGE